MKKIKGSVLNDPYFLFRYGNYAISIVYFEMWVQWLFGNTITISLQKIISHDRVISVHIYKLMVLDNIQNSALVYFEHTRI